MAENLYNWDKTGFVISHTNTTQQIMTLEAYQSQQI